jgi:hypothetical protein
MPTEEAPLDEIGTSTRPEDAVEAFPHAEVEA